MGGSSFSNCSMLEAITLGEETAEKKLNWTYAESNRVGDHIWWVSDVSKFRKQFPEWNYKYNLRDILVQIFENNKDRWC